MKAKFLIAATLIYTTCPGVAMAETVGDYIDRSKKIEEMDFQIKKLERQLRQAELNHEIANVGKEKVESSEPRLSEQTIQVQDYPINMNDRNTQTQEDKPSYEDLVERQKDRILDGAFVSSVFGLSDSEDMTAEIFLQNQGIVEVVEGDPVGNWKITNVSLRAVEAQHVKNGETKRLTSKGTKN